MKLSFVILNRNTDNNKSVAAELMKPEFLQIWILHPDLPISLLLQYLRVFLFPQLRSYYPLVKPL